MKENENASIKDFLSLLKSHTLGISVAVILAILSATSTILQPLVISKIVDGFNNNLVDKFISLLVILLIISSVLSALKQLLLENINEELVFKIRKSLISSGVRFKLSVLDSHDIGSLTSVLSTDTSQLRGILSQGVVDLTSQFFTMLFALAMMFYIDWILFIFSIGAVVLLFFSGVLLGTKTRPASARLQNSLGNMSSEFEHVLHGLRTIKTFQAESIFQNKLEDVARLSRFYGKKVSVLKAIVSGFSSFALQIMLLVVIGIGAVRVSSGTLSIGDLSAFIMYVMLVLTPAAMIGGVLSSINEGLGAYSRIKSFLSEPIEDKISARINLNYNSGESIVAKGVEFSYNNSKTHKILERFDLSIKTNTINAIVGPSGSGKTTFFEIIERFYDNYDGSLKIFGVDMKDLATKDIRGICTLIEQNPSIFSGSVKDNLKLANNESSDEECIQALNAVQLFQDLDNSQKLRKKIGEYGNNLSGGEKQRLALARAFLSKSKIILLDESTSNLDSMTEKLIQECIVSMAHNKTVVIIAHRLSTIKNADCIYLLKDHRIQDFGTHEELLNNEYYRNLVESQFIDL